MASVPICNLCASGRKYPRDDMRRATPTNVTPNGYRWCPRCDTVECVCCRQPVTDLTSKQCGRCGQVWMGRGEKAV